MEIIQTRAYFMYCVYWTNMWDNFTVTVWFYFLKIDINTSSIRYVRSRHKYVLQISVEQSEKKIFFLYFPQPF